MNNALSKEIEIGISGIRNLVEAVKNTHGFDLGCFAITSFKRRVMKALHINEISSVEALTDMLVNDKQFFEKFLRDINVECTEFFRDPAFWRYFRNDILPALDRKHSQIKIWIPGCSSGEEVLTAAIAIQEAGLKDKTKIYATDISPEIIKELTNKVYSNNKFEISETNYQRFNEEKTDFSRYTITERNGFRIRDDLYENIELDVYKYQNAQKIKGFNLIICRNVFIYYTLQYQEMLLGLFAENLSYNGCLAIGIMEDISWCKDFYKFKEIDKNDKVYSRV